MWSEFRCLKAIFGFGEIYPKYSTCGLASAEQPAVPEGFLDLSAKVYRWRAVKY